MRHRILTPVLLSLALLMSGWGGVLAAAFCTHDAGRPAAMAEDHDCCRASLESEQDEHQHCAVEASAHSSHEAMAMDETDASSMPAEGTTANAVASFAQNDTACLHCVSRNGLPTTVIVAREPEQKKRDASGFALAARKLVVPLAAAFFAEPPLNRQGAPPGVAARRHLLLNVFVI